jgi:ribosome maturation factor RimP
MLEKKERLKNKAVEYVKRQGFSVFEAKVFFANKRLVLKMLVDFKEGGISLGDCSFLSRGLASYIDEDLLPTPYLVEVSSPGIKREFKRPEDFLRVKGRPVDVWLSQSFQESKHYQGVVLGVSSNKVTIGKRDRTLEIPVSLIRKARQTLK